MSIVRNERLKLLANSLNAIGLALVGLAVLRPMIEATQASWLAVAGWGITAIVLHVVSHYILGHMK